MQELSLVKVIDSKLIQNNVTEAVISALKDKYGNLKLRSLDDKESYLEVKQAARECAKVRTLAVKICKEGREEAVKAQKQWIAKEKEVVGKVAEVEDALDAEIKRFDDEVARKDAEEKRLKEEAYINRQAQLTKMGATYQNGSFVLGEASFEAELIKGSSDDVWEEAVIPKFKAEYEKIEAVRVAEEKKRQEEESAFRAAQEKMRQEQEAFRQQQEEFNRQKEAAAQAEREKQATEQRERDRIAREAEFEAMKIKAAEEAEAKRIADIEAAVRKEKERQEEEVRQAELRKQQQEEARLAELAAAGDKIKWDELVKTLKAIQFFEMRSGQYRRKMQIAKECVDKIISL